MGVGGAVTPDTAITLSISKLAALLGVKPALLKNILGTTHVELRDQPKIVAGGVDSEREMGFWTFFNNIGSIHTLNIPRERSIFNLRRRCLNGAVNDGHHSLLIEPAANSTLLIYYASLKNADTVDRAAYILLNTAGNYTVSNLNIDITLTAGTNLAFPCLVVEGLNVTPKAPLIVTDAFEFIMALNAIAVNQDTYHFILYSYIGDAPTITETAPAGAVWSDVA